MAEQKIGIEFTGDARDFIAAAKQVNTQLAAVEKSIREVGQKVEAGNRKMRESFQGLGSELSSMVGSMVGLGAAITAASVATHKLIGEAIKLETAMAAVNTLLSAGAPAIEQWTDAVVGLSKRSSKDVVDLANGLYDAISAGVPATMGAGGAMEFLDAAQKAATAGLATTKDTVNAFTTILNTYGDKAVGAAEGVSAVTAISDAFFQTISDGVVTMPLMAGNIGEVAATAKAMGVPFRDMMAMVAQVSKIFPNSAQAFTAVRDVIQSIGAPTMEVRKRWDELGVSVGQSAIASKGVLGVLQDVVDATGGNAENIRKLIPEVLGFNATMQITRNEGRDFTEMLQRQGEAAGQTDNAVAKMSDTVEVRLAKAWNQFKAAATPVTDWFKETAAQILDGWSRILNAIGAASSAMERLRRTVGGGGDGMRANRVADVLPPGSMPWWVPSAEAEALAGGPAAAAALERLDIERRKRENAEREAYEFSRAGGGGQSSVGTPEWSDVAAEATAAAVERMLASRAPTAEERKKADDAYRRSKQPRGAGGHVRKWVNPFALDFENTGTPGVDDEDALSELEQSQESADKQRLAREIQADEQSFARRQQDEESAARARYADALAAGDRVAALVDQRQQMQLAQEAAARQDMIEQWKHRMGDAVTWVAERFVDVAAFAIGVAGRGSAGVAELRERVDEAKTFVTNVAQYLPEVFKVIEEAIPQLGVVFAESMPKIAAALADHMPMVVRALLRETPRIINALVASLPDLIRAVQDSIPELIHGILSHTVPALIARIPDIVQAGIDALINPDLIKRVADAIVSGIWQAIKSVIPGLGGGGGNFLEDAAGLLNPINTFEKIGDFLGLNQGGFVPNIQRFANGGMAKAMRPPDTVIAGLEPGEWVVRRDAAMRNKDALKQLNAGGTLGGNVSVNMQARFGTRDLGALLSRLLVVEVQRDGVPVRSVGQIASPRVRNYPSAQAYLAR